MAFTQGYLVFSTTVGLNMANIISVITGCNLMTTMPFEGTCTIFYGPVVLKPNFVGPGLLLRTF